MMVLSLGLLVSAAVAGGALAADTAVTGHLRDGLCFVTMGAHGPSHKKCAMGCAKAGIPVLLVEDKTEKFYVLLPPKDGAGVAQFRHRQDGGRGDGDRTEVHQGRNDVPNR